MKANRPWRRITALLFSFLLYAACPMVTALAYGEAAAGRTASLTVYFGKNGDGFPEVEFRVYRVADLSEAGGYTLSGDFREYPVSLENLDSSGWRALAQTLDAYAARDGLQPLRTEKTGQDGRAVFPGLSVGLYLVTGERFADEGTTAAPEPLLVGLPGLSQEGWNDDVEISCKFDSEDAPSGPVKRKLLKVWKDDGREGERPEEIAVQLLKNGMVADTVTLSRENNWEYTWENLDGGSTWQVAELETPEGYTVSVAQEGTAFVMTNTRSGTPPSEPDIPPGLPQTGMLWWPVPLLVCGGLLLVAAGLFVRRRQGEPNEK